MRKLVSILMLCAALVLSVACSVYAVQKAEVQRLSEEEVKQGEQIEAGVKQATDVLNATLSAAVQGSFDSTTALEVVGRIRVAYLSLENAKLAREVWVARLQAEKACNKCLVDLQAKVLKQASPKETVKRE